MRWSVAGERENRVAERARARATGGCVFERAARRCAARGARQVSARATYRPIVVSRLSIVIVDPSLPLRLIRVSVPNILRRLRRAQLEN